MVRPRDVSQRGNYAREEQSMNSWRRQSMNSVSVLVLAVIAIVIALAPMVWAADVVEGRIRNVDPSGRMVTLDDGTRLTIPPMLTIDKTCSSRALT